MLIWVAEKSPSVTVAPSHIAARTDERAFCIIGSSACMWKQQCYVHMDAYGCAPEGSGLLPLTAL